MWTAPEFLRNQDSEEMRTCVARQKGDVYSFAIICQEILLRNGSFWVETEDPEMLPLTPKGLFLKKTQVFGKVQEKKKRPH